VRAFARGEPRADVVQHVNRTLIEIMKRKGVVRATPDLVATAVTGVVVCKVNSGRWCSKTAAGEMTKLKIFVDGKFPGTSNTPMWKKIRTELESMRHVPNQAPPLSWVEISSILGATKAVFWLALLT